MHTAFGGIEPPKVSGRTDYAAFTPLWGCHAMPPAWRFSSVARKYGLTVQKLKKLNGLRRDQINVGQRLKVR